jgi:hypothetical protein
MKKTSADKDALLAMLKAGDFQAIINKAEQKRGMVRILIGLSYDKETLHSWRAMDAIGRITLIESPEKVRIILQRLLWMMREESGTNPWSAAEIVGEIIARNFEPFKDIIPIVICFAEEPIMRAGSLRAMWRIASVAREHVSEFAGIALTYLNDKDPQVRGYAALALGACGYGDTENALSALKDDSAGFLLYIDNELKNVKVSDVIV